MKKTLTLILLSTIVSSTAFCQYFTVKLGGGYSWSGLQQSTTVLTFQPGTTTDPAYSQIIPLVNYATTDSARSKYKSNLYDGYGQGGHFDFAIGYMINPYFGVQIDGAYLWGHTISAIQNFDDALLGPNATIHTTTYSTGLSINPSLVFRAAPASAKFSPYGRMGLALPVLGSINHELDVTAPNFPFGYTTSTIKVKTESTVSIGFQGAMGVSYRPIPLLSIFAEINGNYLFVRARQSSLTQYDLNIKGNLGNPNQLAVLHPYSIVTNFVDKLDENSNTEELGKRRDPSGNHNGQAGYVDDSKPRDALRQVANLGAFGFTVGVTFNMSKKIFQDPFGKKARKQGAGA